MTGSQPTDRDEALGGDPACWADQFENDPTEPRRVTNLIAHARNAFTRGPVWTAESDDLNVNLLVFHRGQSVDEHVNAEVDVLLVGVDGEGVVTIDGEPHALPPGHTVIVPKGARRSTRVMGDRFAYLTCHRRRPGLIPTVGKRKTD